MWGAIIGDLAGSLYEFGQVKKVSHIALDTLILKDSFFSDDTILTVAILDAILNDRNYEYYLKKYANEYKEYKPNFRPFFKSAFSPRFVKWVNNNEVGNSNGNGAMMRISPVGYLFDSKNKVIANAKLATIPSHNSEEAIKCATIVAQIIYLARKGYQKEKIIELLKLNYIYSPFEKFNSTCYKTIDNCLYALFTSNSYEEAVIKIITFGGDTDTNACIVGSMAEALFGIDKAIIEQVKQKIPENFVKKLEQGYSRVRNLK